MNISEPFIRRPVMTVLLTLTIIWLGLLSYSNLAVSNLPDVNYPTINLTIAFPGASPTTMANSVASPLEKQFMSIPGIQQVTSTNTLGQTQIVLQFDINKDINDAAQDVQAAINFAKSQLPPKLPSDPVYKKVNPGDTAVLYIALTSDTVPLSDLYTYGYSYIGQRLSMVEGVAQVFVYGSPFAVRIQVDPGSLATRGITLSEVSAAVAAGSPFLPTGQIDGKHTAFTVNVDGQIVNAEGYNSLVIAYRNGAPVRIEDVGRAIDSVQNDRINQLYVDKEIKQPTVVLAILRQPGANIINVANGVKNYLPELEKELPSSVDLRLVFDRSLSIQESISEVKFTMVLAFILVVLIIFLYLGKVTDTVIPSLALPVSIIGTFIVMYFLNYTIDNLSVLGLTLAIGFIVDDAIVVLENIVRRVEQGEGVWEASLEGSKQISFTILSMTLSLAAVFIPLVFLQGLIGKIFQEFAITLMIVTLISGIVSLTLTPMLCSRFITERSKHKIGFFERFSNRLNTSMLNVYRPALEWNMRHQWIAVTIGTLSLILTFFFFKILPKDFIPDDDIGFIMGYNLAAEGTSSEQMIQYQKEVIKVLRSDPSVEALVSIAAYPDYRQGINFIRLKPLHERPPAGEVIHKLYPKLMSIPGVNTFLKSVPLIDLQVGTVSRGSYQYSLQSIHSSALYDSAKKLIEAMQKDPAFSSVTSDMAFQTPQLEVNILRDKASTLGVTAEEIEETLLLGYSGNRIIQILTPLNQYDVIVELKRAFQRSVSSLADLYVRSTTALASRNLVPLTAVAEWKEGVGPSNISHINQFPAVTITFNLPPNVPLGTALNRLQQLSQEVLSPGVQGVAVGAADTFQSSINSSAYLLVFAVVTIYIVLGILYESFIHPITILSTLPPAVLGGLLTLWIFGMPLSMYGYLGIILLIGIVKKNGIMVVDYALEFQRHQHMKPEQAIFEACLVRFRPIMMTTVSAIAGAVPIAFALGAGAASRRPLGFVIIGGLVLSQLITLFLTPIIYLYLDRFNRTIEFENKEE